MKYALALSLLANLILAVALFRRTGWRYCHVRFWFLRKPDFARVREVVDRVLAEPEFAEWFEFMDFVAGPWMADLDVRHRQLVGSPAWAMGQQLAARLKAETGLPCWHCRMVMEGQGSPVVVGLGLGIGHSAPGSPGPRAATATSGLWREVPPAGNRNTGQVD